MDIKPTGVNNLARDGKTGIYYARKKILEKTKYRSLRTKSKETAILILAGKVQEILDEFAPAESRTIQLGANATFADAVKIYDLEIEVDPNLKALSSKKARRSAIATIRRSFDFNQELRKIADAGRVVLPVTNALLGGDPCPQFKKILCVRYIYNGMHGGVEIAEDQVLRLPYQV